MSMISLLEKWKSDRETDRNNEDVLLMFSNKHSKVRAKHAARDCDAPMVSKTIIDAQHAKICSAPSILEAKACHGKLQPTTNIKLI
jgi:hypothetical protein